MKLLFIAIASIMHVLITVVRQGGRRPLAAEMIALRIQLIAVQRKQRRAPNLTKWERLWLAVCGGLISKHRLRKISIIVSPATLLKFHRALVNRKYSFLYSNTARKAGRPRISNDLRELIIRIKEENPRFGCPQIASIVFDRTGVEVGIETVRRILCESRRPHGKGPSWLMFLGHRADSLWSVDIFCVESILLKIYWVMIVMDQFSRSIIGFAVTQGARSGESLCYMFNQIIGGKASPRYLSRDNDPLYKFYRWQTNIEMLGIKEVRSIPFTPTSHPYVERAIGTTRREFLDHILFWNEADLARKLSSYRQYFNEARVHQGISGKTPGLKYKGIASQRATPVDLVWQKFCGGLFNVPMAA
jgi:transposase InsO family protein